MVAFTEEIFNRKLHFLCSGCLKIQLIYYISILCENKRGTKRIVCIYVVWWMLSLYIDGNKITWKRNDKYMFSSNLFSNLWSYQVWTCNKVKPRYQIDLWLAKFSSCSQPVWTKVLPNLLFAWFLFYFCFAFLVYLLVCFFVCAKM